MSIKAIVRQHPVLLRALRFLKYRGQKPKIVLPTDLVGMTNEWVKQLPNEFDLIVGVPRAGLLIADAIALYYGVPWATPSGVNRQEFFFTHNAVMPEIKRILVVEDFIKNGGQLRLCAEAVQRSLPDAVVKTGSLLVASEAKGLVDYYYKVNEGFLIPEWDIIKLRKEKSLVSDLDGVLCKDPPECALQTPEVFRDWIGKAEPNLIPRYKLDAVVTVRDEAFRKETEAWLQKNKVAYNELLMFAGSGLRPSLADSIRHKVEHLKRLNPSWFWESNSEIAKAVNKKTGIRTLCTDEMAIYF